MVFSGFSTKDFDVFTIDGLDERMEALRERIQPKFQTIGEVLADDIAVMAGDEMFLHIAKHARRSKNPPKDTWLAICDDKRGYKKHPHFQVGLFDDHVFIWLAYINELADKPAIGQTLLNHIDTFQSIPDDYVISLDHTKKDAFQLGDTEEATLKQSLERFRDVKKGEFLIGRHIKADDPLLKDGNAFLQFAKETFETLMPIYHLSAK
ncbi:YktB family protein [Tuberibacillus sp. Marseille-P3662]|uniref:YktB family protein n=1 Tax=Tuberibacillus sp. Marseille-P3662 TaxID=1965358 RepID=UPI000A1CBDBF|nr:DUF1054 domain-containing protein [Tuberibacillus sp. Marseille-P3662]